MFAQFVFWEYLTVNSLFLLRSAALQKAFFDPNFFPLKIRECAALIEETNILAVQLTDLAIFPPASARLARAWFPSWSDLENEGRRPAFWGRRVSAQSLFPSFGR